MATLHPFRALRPHPHVVEAVASVPYDVINTAEARALAQGNPLSFLHVIRPEIDVPAGTDEHADVVYAKGAENLKAFAASDHFLEEDAPSLYVYRLVMDGRAQTGVFGCVAVADYDADVILKHEKTRPDKEDDRTRHLLTQQAHAEPVMLTFRDDKTIADLISNTVATAALYDFTASDGVQHTVWRVAEPGIWVQAFADIPAIYVADGHHRCKAASRAAEAYREQGHTSDEVGYFPAVLFPMGDMAILAYNRIVKRLPEGGAAFLQQLEARTTVTPTDQPSPETPGTIGVLVDRQWYRVVLPRATSNRVVDTLDVARLGEHILEPLLGITNPRTDPNIGFVGGIRGIGELERLVEAGEAELAIAMYPTQIEELLDVSDAGELMPPKSTWFEPKLRSGLLVHRF
ncbi:MAG: DUF1015 family protein [Rhodothermales bacterium]